MDFIELIFGLSPDGGDGSTEALYILALVAVVMVVAGRRWLRRRGRRI